MKIDNIKVYGLAESIVASGLPMVKKYNAKAFAEYTKDYGGYAIERARKLASCKGGESHDCYLAGVIVQMNITAPRYFFPEMQRYHFIDIVSSTSTMHRLKAFLENAIELRKNGNDLEYCDLINAHFSKATSTAIINGFVYFAECLEEQIEDIERLKANLPEGWLQTARVTTNYRQIKTILHQRKNHRLQEWRDFCDTLKQILPMPELFTGGDE